MLLMPKTYVGSRLRQLRRERNLSQASLAATLQLSASYVNQIEHDVRPLTVPVLKRITEAFGVDATFFSRDDDSRLLAELKDVVEDQELGTPHIELQELSELVYRHPPVARSVVEIHRRYSNARDKLTLATDSRVSSSEPLSMPHDEVRDFFYSRQNYLDDLDHAAERLAGGIGVDVSEYLTHESSPTLDLDEWMREWGVTYDEDAVGALTTPEPAPSPRTVYLLQRKETRIGKDLGKTTGWVHRAALKAKGVQELTGVAYERIDDAGLHITVGGKPRLLEVDNVVICAGQDSVRELVDQLAEAGVTHHVIGGADVASELDAKRAIKQGTELAAAI